MGVRCNFCSVEDSLIDYYLNSDNFSDEYKDTDYFDVNFIWVSGKYHSDKERFLTIGKYWKTLDKLLHIVDTTDDKKLSKLITKAPRLTESEWIMYHKSDEVKTLSIELNKIEVSKLFSKRNLLEVGEWALNNTNNEFYFKNLKSFFNSVTMKGYGIIIKIE